MWCGYKIKEFNFSRFPVNLETESCVWYWLVRSPPFTVTISRSWGKKFSSSHFFLWIVFLCAVRWSNQFPLARPFPIPTL
jgi:hypothetical protein